MRVSHQTLSKKVNKNILKDFKLLYVFCYATLKLFFLSTNNNNFSLLKWLTATLANITHCARVFDVLCDIMQLTVMLNVHCFTHRKEKLREAERIAQHPLHRSSLLVVNPSPPALRPVVNIICTCAVKHTSLKAS